MKTLREVIRKYMESLKLTPRPIFFFKDPIYFRSTPLSVYITNISATFELGLEVFEKIL